MKTLVLIDVQNDFMPGGPLEVPEGNLIIPVINKIDLPSSDIEGTKKSLIDTFGFSEDEFILISDLNWVIFFLNNILKFLRLKFNHHNIFRYGNSRNYKTCGIAFYLFILNSNQNIIRI